MKTKNAKIRILVLSLMVALSSVACNQGRNNPNTATPFNTAWGPMGPNGINGGMIPQPGMFNPGMWPGGAGAWPGQQWPGGGINMMQQNVLASAYGQSADSIGLGLLFFGTGGWGAGGQVFAQGELIIGQAAYSQGCPLLPGYYQVAAQSPGIAQAGQVGNMALVAAGQTQFGVAQIIFNLVQAQIVQGVRVGPSGQQYGSTLMGQIFVQGVVVNGQQMGCMPQLANIVIGG